MQGPSRRRQGGGRSKLDRQSVPEREDPDHMWRVTAVGSGDGYFSNGCSFLAGGLCDGACGRQMAANVKESEFGFGGGRETRHRVATVPLKTDQSTFGIKFQGHHVCRIL